MSNNVNSVFIYIIKADFRNWGNNAEQNKQNHILSCSYQIIILTYVQAVTPILWVSFALWKICFQGDLWQYFYFLFRTTPAVCGISHAIGVESELRFLVYTTATATQDLSHVCDLQHSSWQHQILKPLSKTRD